jgi:hypothetical protein
MLSKSLSPNAPIETNAFGGKQSSIPFRFDLLRGIASKAMFKLAGVLEHGAKKFSEDNWHNVSPQEHMNHALTHAFAWLAGEKQDDHVSHFHCRALMFAATLEDSKWATPLGPSVKMADVSDLKKETYGEMLNRHHKESQEFGKVKEVSEKEFFDTIYP